MDIKKFLDENFILFNGLPPHSIDELVSFGGINEQKFLQGEIIQSCNSCDKIGILVKGKAVIRSDIDGVIINKLGKNSIYGAAALFDEPTYKTIVQAVTDCSIITIDKQFIVHCIETYPQIALNYICFLAKKISFLNNKINTYTAKNAENKLFAYLFQLPRVDNYLELTQDMSTIAKMLGIGRATLYRSFDKLEKNGLIIKKDKKIIFNEV